MNSEKSGARSAEQISEAIGELDEKIVSPAAERRAAWYREKRSKDRGRKIWLSIASAAACLGIVGGIFAMSKGDGILILSSAETLAKAVYPEAAPYPDQSQCIGSDGMFNGYAFDRVYQPWQEQGVERRSAAKRLSGLSEFYRSTVQAFLSDSGSENRVYSPISLYSALAMLAETTDGESREQILALLNMENMEALREQAKNLWAANYRNDGATTSILANSVWMNQGVDFVQETVDRLAGDYYASSYRGDPASEEMNRLLKEWLNEQTGGLLGEAVKNTKLSPETIMALYSTVYFRAKWDQEFQAEDNDEKIFHGGNGDVTAEFMNADNFNYFWGEDYGAIDLYFANGGGMWLILPDEDKTVDDVLISGEYLEMIEKMYRYEWKDRQEAIVHYSVPKFDVSSEITLNEELKALGVTDIFSTATADFSPLAENTEELMPYVSSARHAARVAIDEQGCTAAAFTEMSVEAGGGYVPEGEIYFVLDRPFLFVITSDTGGILFAGTVNVL